MPHSAKNGSWIEGMFVFQLVGRNGLTSMPKSLSTDLAQASSSCAAPQSTHCSSVIDCRHCRKGSASGPAGCLNCQFSLL